MTQAEENKLFHYVPDVGEKVRVWYFGVAQDAEVLKATGTRVRVRFRNQQGYVREAWRSIVAVHRFLNSCRHCEYIRKWRQGES